jgi:hypothetical protein
MPTIKPAELPVAHPVCAVTEARLDDLSPEIWYQTAKLAPGIEHFEEWRSSITLRVIEAATRRRDTDGASLRQIDRHLAREARDVVYAARIGVHREMIDDPSVEVRLRRTDPGHQLEIHTARHLARIEDPSALRAVVGGIEYGELVCSISERLSPDSRRVFALLTAGDDLESIATTLRLTGSAVRRHVKTIQAVARAILDPDDVLATLASRRLRGGDVRTDGRPTRTQPAAA